MYFVTPGLIFTVIALWLLWSFLWKNFFATKIKGPWAFPIIGSAYVFFGGTHNILENTILVVKKYRPLCKLWLGNKLTIFPSNPDDIQTILNKSLEKEEGYRYIKTVFGHGLFTSPVSEWKGHRKVIVSTLNQQVLNSFMDTYNIYTRELVEKLKIDTKDGKYIDMFPVMTQCTLDIICSSIMGTQMNAMKEESQFIMWMTRVAELAIIRMFNVYLWPELLWKLSPISKESHELDQRIYNYVKTVIHNKRHKGLKSHTGKKIFLDYLVELTDREGRWSDEELTNETRSVIMAGSDATALTLSYCLVMLAMFQDIQEKVYEELCSVFGDSDRFVTVDDLPHLQYLDRFIKETLRVFPVTSMIGRELTSDMTLGEHLLPKGTSIGLPILYIHRNPEYYPDPLKFDPDRFLPEEVAKRHPCTFIPFSFGPRNCIGYRYAMMTMKVVLATLLRSFKMVDTPYKEISKLKIKFDIATKVDEGYPVRMELRKNIVAPGTK
ncbi:cytochrome P450 4C1-like [Tribolium madens]|uniref:cytochrome P450 4C1-like n=1 Tax=Tribolium madens TaxID=41895 RepID=UPI001CF75704|nr:cytochrome P450 4C1-like [Tribolium madens]